MTYALVFPSLDPIALQIGPLAVRWYSLAYVAGFLIGWWLVAKLLCREGGLMSRKQLDDLLLWVVVGVVLGGRLGYVLVYQPSYFGSNPLAALQIWQGGMSFHGGMLGSIFGVLGFCYRTRIPFWPVMDVVALVAPIGLGLGRIANFINGELYGRVTDLPWGMVFPHGGPLPRHPSQLYQAGLEGVVFSVFLWSLFYYGKAQAYPRRLSGAFLIGYATLRFTGECFRQPDEQIGYLWAGVTMGQLLCLPMLAYGAYLWWRSLPPRQA